MSPDESLQAAAARAAGAWEVPSSGPADRAGDRRGHSDADPSRGHRGAPATWRAGAVQDRQRPGRSWRQQAEVQSMAGGPGSARPAGKPRRPRVARLAGELPADQCAAGRGAGVRFIERRDGPDCAGQAIDRQARSRPTWPRSASAQVRASGRPCRRTGRRPGEGGRARRRHTRSLNPAEMSRLSGRRRPIRRPRAGRGDLPPRGHDLPEVPRHRRRGRPGRAPGWRASAPVHPSII